MNELDEVPDAAPTLEQVPILGIGAATETPPSAVELQCFVCGQSLPTRSTSSEVVPPPIATMSQIDVERELHELLDEARFDERRVLLFVARRLVAVGQRAYGPLDIAVDRRDFERERCDEIGDLLVYSGIEAIKRQQRG